MPQNASLATPPLSRADQAELLEYLSSDQVTFQSTPLAPGELGEPVTVIAIVALSMTAISAMCTWLAARGTNVGLTLNGRAAGMSGGFALTLNGQSKPEEVRAELEAKGIAVPEK